MPKRHGKCACMPSHAAIISLRSDGSFKSSNHSTVVTIAPYQTVSEIIYIYMFFFPPLANDVIRAAFQEVSHCHRSRCLMWLWEELKRARSGFTEAGVTNRSPPRQWRDSTGNHTWKGTLWTQKPHCNSQESGAKLIFISHCSSLKCLKHCLDYFYKRGKMAPIKAYFKNRRKYRMAEWDSKILLMWKISLSSFISI